MLLGFYVVSVSHLNAATRETCVDTASTTPSSQFTDVANDQNAKVIEDFKTGLMWSRCFLGADWSVQDVDCRVSSSPETTWKDALKEVNNANANAYLGYSDWRLPNIKELTSIVERRCYNPATNDEIFPLSGNSATGGFWSSTPVSGSESIRLVSFFNGQLLSQHYSESNYVRLVRDVTP